MSRRPQTPLELAHRYDAEASTWRQTAERFRLQSAYRECLIRSGIPTALARSGAAARTLDCGIGTASLSIALGNTLSVSIAPHGIDVSREMLAMAEVSMREAGFSPGLKHANVLAIPYADQHFDMVMAGHVLEHLPDPRRGLMEMIRVLKPGGRLFVCLTRRSLFGALIQLRWRTWAITARQGTRWLHDCGLSDIGSLPLKLSAGAGRASIAFWARRVA